ncbi:hypothetical protein [Candidatus Nitrosacidococcus tergens]|uniref:hypothetical protein n=1 Tax=Candidatus Nitrosacidococcus tergens TaxID=553981 RepID=UPI0018D87997|nr:hypothetical protein [Candidatus Nitrosacidococcus tergens]
MAEQQTIDWALVTKPHEIIKRSAILESLRETNKLKDPWYSAWRLIEESWDDELPQCSSIDTRQIQHRITNGERSGSLLSSIISLVRPRLVLSSAQLTLSTAAGSKRPRWIKAPLYPSISSCNLAKLDVYRLDSIKEIDFLVDLATRLECAMNNGLSLECRLRREDVRQFDQLYYVQYLKQNENEYNWDVDKSHQGIAPSVKLLNAVVRRIAELDVSQARAFVSRWKQTPTPVHLRLWASLSQCSVLTPADELSEILPVLEDRPFWKICAYPEIAILRSLRFNDITDDAQQKVIARLKKGPPRSLWLRKAECDRVKDAQQYFAMRELYRIKFAGGKLPHSVLVWLTEYLGPYHNDLQNMDSIYFDFRFFTVSSQVTQPDDQFSVLYGEKRLRALEDALVSPRKSWNDPYGDAANWIRSEDHATEILTALEASRYGGAEYPNLWDHFGQSHSAPSCEDAETPKYQKVGNRVLALLEQLPIDTIRQAIQGITHWMLSWKQVIMHSSSLLAVWGKLWSAAVAETNQTSDESDQEELANLHTLNTADTAIGKLVDIFLALLPRNRGNENPFATNNSLCSMRDAIISADGKSELIGKYCLIKELPYFLKADKKWSQQNLIAPLVSNDVHYLALWHAISQCGYQCGYRQFTGVLQEIGNHFADRVVDSHLDREIKDFLLSILVLDSLYAFLEERKPVVANTKIQQALRNVDDEVRATAAQTVQDFLRSRILSDSETKLWNTEELFQLSVKPFLSKVWPQECSLATPGVSRAFAKLPASAGKDFVQAVDAIMRFMVPFDCWYIHDFGFDEINGSKLESIDTLEKAVALLQLLNVSIGTLEESVIPDLAEGLKQIQTVSPQLIQDPIFRRLATVARRR